MRNLSHSSCTDRISKSLIVIASTILSSNIARVWPKQLRGPNSKGLHAHLTEWRGCSGPTSHRSRMKEWGPFSYFGLRWMMRCMAQTLQPSVGCIFSLSSTIFISERPARKSDAGGNNQRASLMMASVYGSWFNNWGFCANVREMSFWFPNTLSCSTRI